VRLRYGAGSLGPALLGLELWLLATLALALEAPLAPALSRRGLELRLRLLLAFWLGLLLLLLPGP
jgi:hypothetical protein